ncbi:glutamine--tRNA ligase [Candidatus Karelsulcia muelleri]
MSTSHFVEQIIEKDIKKGLPKNKLSFRFPPEPNGCLHLGHVKSIYLNYSLARKYKCPFILRFDDTNPRNEDTKFIKAIKKDINWLGFKWCQETYSSDYFLELYKLAQKLILKGKAYVDSQTKHKIKEQRRTSYEVGIESPYRKRSKEDNLELFKQMKKGYFKEGECVLRAKIDMNSPNINLRDPIMYRIIHTKHYKTGTKWFIYPTYDWAHGQNDYLEQISHSLCTLEFQHNKPLYNWFISQIKSSGHILPKQYEFSRLNLNYSIMSKTKMHMLIEQHIVDNWDDPRLPTISGLRRRGVTPDAICKFIKEIGISKRENNMDISLLEFYLNKQLAKIAEPVMVVFNPLTLKIDNLNETKWLRFKDRKLPFSKEIYIESKDFISNISNKKDKVWRLSIGQKVRLKAAFIIKAKSIIKHPNGTINYILCKIYTEKSNEKATLPWVSKNYSLPITINLYGKLFNIKCPDKVTNFTDYINHKSIRQVNAYAENWLINANYNTKYQFIRKGYFCLDQQSDTQSTTRKLVFNQIISFKPKGKTVSN